MWQIFSAPHNALKIYEISMLRKSNRWRHIRPKLSSKFLPKLGSNPARKARHDLQYNSDAQKHANLIPFHNAFATCYIAIIVKVSKNM